MSTLVENVTPMEQAYATLALNIVAPATEAAIEPVQVPLENRVVAASEAIARVARNSSGALAVLAGYINQQRLYAKAGFDTMADFAAARLGILSPFAFKKLMTAANAVWKLYPERASALIDLVEREEYARIPELPPLPDETKLVHLPRAVANRPPAEAAALLEAAAENKTSSRELERIGKEKPKKAIATGTETRANTSPSSSRAGRHQRDADARYERIAEPSAQMAALPIEMTAAFDEADDGVVAGHLTIDDAGQSRSTIAKFLGRTVELVIKGESFVLRDLGPAPGGSAYMNPVRVVELVKSAKALADKVAQTVTVHD